MPKHEGESPGEENPRSRMTTAQQSSTGGHENYRRECILSPEAPGGPQLLERNLCEAKILKLNWYAGGGWGIRSAQTPNW